MGYGRDYAGAAKVLQLALSKLDRLQLAPAHKLALQVSAYNRPAGPRGVERPPRHRRAIC